MTFQDLNVGDIVTFEEEDHHVWFVDEDGGTVRVDIDVEWPGSWVDACLADGRMSVRWDRGQRWPRP